MTNPAVTQVLLEAALRALMIALVLWLGMRLLRVANAMVQKAAWTMVLAAAVAMPFVVRWQLRPSWATVSLPAANWLKWSRFERRTSQPPAVIPTSSRHDSQLADNPAPEGAEEPPIAADSYAELADLPNATTMSTPTQVTNGTQADAVTPPIRWFTRIVGFAWLLYLSVGAGLLLRLIYGLGSSARLWLQARRVESGLEVPDGIQVRWSRNVGSPVNIGSGVLLPHDYAEWDDEKLRVVLAHEAAHIQQRDFYLQMLAGLYAAVVWFSPLGWWLKRKLSELGEAISDKAGLDAAGSPVAYAELLLEFAARPRPTFAGVAMAHSTNLHQRIERLLNESSFRHVFAGKRHSALVLALPAVLIATTALVHVQAAAIPTQSSFTQSATQPAADAQPAASRMGQSKPDSDVGVEPNAATSPKPQEPEVAPSPKPAPSPEPKVVVAPLAIKPDVHVLITVPQIAPMVELQKHLAILTPSIKDSLVLKLDMLNALSAINPIQLSVPSADDAANGRNHDTYRILGDDEHRRRFDGDISAECETAAGKTRQNLQGKMIFVCHDGKPYIIDDPATIAQINDIDNQMNAKSDQMKVMAQQMRDQSQQVREQAREERKAAEKLPKPDITKEIAELDAAAAALKADQDGNISREQLQELQRKLSEVQRRLISTEVKVDVNMSVAMSKFSADQGKFGEQMGKIGSEIGQLAHERDQKIRSIIDESLKNGKAKPVN